MSNWDFKTINGDELSSTQTQRIPAYIQALKVAHDSTVANPIFSQYFVKESIGTKNDGIFPAGNIEYGLCQALHGEETAVGVLRSRLGEFHNDPLILGIATSGIANPCGNCRDIMLDELGPNFELVTGGATGGPAFVATMRDYLVDNFPKANEIDYLWLSEEIEDTIRMGKKLENDAYSPSSHPQRHYSALVVTQKDRYYGAFDGVCDYHSLYALRDATRQARRVNDPFIKRVIITCEVDKIPPHVMYKDRQHLHEMNLQAELLSDHEQDPLVYLVSHNNQKGFRIWQTSVKKWLPYPFSARNFGPEFIENLTVYYKSL